MIGEVILLGLGSAFWPLLVAATVVMLATPRPLPLLVGYLAGGLLMSIGIGIAILAVLDRSGAVQGPDGPTTSAAIDIGLGAALLLIALGLVRGWDRRLRRRRDATPTPKTPSEPWTQRALGRGSPRMAFVVGIALSLPSVYYLSALKSIDEHHGLSAAGLGLILVFCAVQFLIIEVPLVSFLVAPDRTREGVADLHRWMDTHLRQVGASVAAVIGALLVLRGIVDLVT